MRWSGRWLGWFAAALVSVWSPGCASVQLQRTARQEAEQSVEQAKVTRLANELAQFTDFFQAKVDGAASEIERKAAAREQRKAALLWKVRMSSEVRGATFNDNPAAGLADTWTLCVRMANYLDNGDGKDLFGPLQPTAQAAAHTVNVRIQEIAAGVVPDEKLAAMRATIDDYAREHPITGVFEQQTAQPISSAPGNKVLGLLVGLPLAPIRAVGTIAAGGQTISDIKQVASRFTDVVEDLPASVRWQLQLLGIDLAESRTAGDFREGLAGARDDLRRAISTAEKLPAEIRSQGERLMADVEAKQPALQATLKEARETTAALNEALRQAREVSERIDRTVAEGTAAAKAWQETAVAVSATVKEIGGLPAAWKGGRGGAATPGASPEPVRAVASVAREPGVAAGATVAVQLDPPTDARPFDINDWTRSAEAIERAAGSTRALLTDVEKMGMPKTVFAQIDTIDSQARGLVDHIAWRSAELAVLVFGLVVVYRWKIVRLIGPRGA